MASATGSRIFTIADMTPAASTQTFTLFPLLPPELRLMVWHFALAQPRIIQTLIYPRDRIDHALQHQRCERPDERAHENYSVIFYQYQSINKLSHVNQESRRATSAFYRVPIPCWLTTPPRDYQPLFKPGIFYFNPDYDYIHQVGYRDWSTIDNLVKFIHDLKTIHDPLHVGLLNLAIDFPTLNGLCRLDFHSLGPLLATSFAETLSRLQEVFFVWPVKIPQRSQRHLGRDQDPGSGFHDIRRVPSLPVMAWVPGFHRLHHDPRPIEHDLVIILDTMHGRRNPSIITAKWGKLLQKLRVNQVELQTEHRIMTQFGRPEGYDYESANEWLDSGHSWFTEKGFVSERRTEEVKPAFGFWLFPLHVFNKHSSSSIDIWPELALADLY
ncbi:uncharacterized protein F4807DRAFT_277797 [Annulohypoxylon truncatum]|uniref:uncharacterized protein n=1 Tax=Annulohypoxylon truncatum TaxID=327061 RepID=UPI002008ADB6|nr:uncharacterized protein F4807DRAFT_277797 [Annulohypoxylon truncatum]KAI1205631.1 hypothetical protein F4807DRAFT_277797 [Annulohypoxylon truncatum]